MRNFSRIPVRRALCRSFLLTLGLETTAAPSCTIGCRVHRDACAEPKIFKMSLWHFSHHHYHRDPRVSSMRVLFPSSPFDASREFQQVQLVARSNKVDYVSSVRCASVLFDAYFLFISKTRRRATINKSSDSHENCDAAVFENGY